ncbi:MAG: restriction endonuclease subunit S [Deltaproteobacteria bacterium]|nr:restriction endonuclease subunit S [Deltaproteobacteria bacterium]
MNTKHLRQKILDLAIRGKLVPQDPADEPASVLLERIRTEKERLRIRGKIKPNNKNSTIFRNEDKSHYEQLPPGWEWCRLGEMCLAFQYGTSQKSDKKGRVAVLRMGNIKNGEIDYSDLVFTSDESDIKKYELKPHELLFNRTNSPEWVGKTAIYRGEIPAIFAGYIIKIKPVIVNPFYLNYIMNSKYHRNICLQVKTDGVNQSNINAQKLSYFVYPIPPLAEQHRIVTTIKSAFEIIDEIERSKTDLQAAVTTAKSKILSLAIRGKLVPQDPNDEPASVLLERIRAERQKLIKAGRIKPSKNESAIFRGCDNSYYTGLPDSWIVARICDVCEPQETKRPAGESFRYIDIEAIDNKRHSVTEPTTVRTNHAPSRAAKGVRTGDTLFSMVRPYLENIAFVTDELSDCIASTGFYVCRPLPEIVFPSYMYHYLTSSYTITGINTYMRGDNSPAIRKDEMDSFPIPVPPFDEQKRIVVAIETAFEQLDSIATTLV